MIVELQSNEKDNIELGSDSNLNSSAMDDTSMSNKMTMHNLKILLTVILISNIWTFFMILIPVVVDVGPHDMYAYQNWYTGSDLIRFMEPIVGLPLNYFIVHFYVQVNPQAQFSTWFVMCFMLSAALYVQGAGFHSASTMFKKSVQSIDHDDEIVQNNRYWIRTVWEHEISHYIYSVGLCCMYTLQQWLYRDIGCIAPNCDSRVTASVDGREPGESTLNMLVLLSAAFHGCIISGAAINFPSGLVTGLLYTGMGLYASFWYTSKYKHPKTTSLIEILSKLKTEYTFSNMFRAPIMCIYTWGFICALVIMFIWISIYGMKTRSEANVT